MITLITCLVAYCVICALIIALVPAVRNSWKKIRMSLTSNLDKVKLYKKLLFWLLVGIGICVCFLITPFLIPIFIKEEKRSKQIDVKENGKRHENYEYINSLGRQGGAGTIHCKDCDYQEDVISFIHGIEKVEEDHPMAWVGSVEMGWTGYQCQSCGQFCTLSDTDKAKKENPFTCSCGGELSRDKAMFCPQCKSRSMDFKMNYIT